MKGKCCHDGHRERLRNRYLDYGIGSLYEHELLELLLFCPIPRKNTNELGHSLISAFGNINGTFAASVEEIAAIKDLGPGSAIFLKILSDAVNDYGNSMAAQTIVDTPEGFSDLFRDFFADAADDLCLLVCPDNDQRITFFGKDILHDTESAKTIISRIIRGGWDRAVLGINHGNRLTAPDNGDLALLKLFSSRLSPLSIDLMDCIIVNKRTTFSFRKSGAVSF